MGILDQLRGSQSTPIGLLEMAASMGTSGLAEMGGGLAYLGALPFGGDAAAQHVKQAVQNAYTYQPRSASAQQMQGVLANIAAPVMQPIAGAGAALGDKTYAATGSPLLAAIATAAPQAAMEFADRANLGALKRAPNSMGMREHWDTPEFKDWSGDAPVISSKDAGSYEFKSGQPVVVEGYNGTSSDIESFDKSKVGERFPYSIGFHFANRPLEASKYAEDIGGNVIPAYIRARNPLVIDAGASSPSMKADMDRFDILRKVYESRKGENPYDSVIVRRAVGDENDGINVIAFSPEQIKSRFNRGTYSNSPRLSD